MRDERLTIRVVADANSSHVRARIKYFVEAGHRVIVISEHAHPIPAAMVVVPRPLTRLGVINSLTKSVCILRALQAHPADITHVHYAQGLPAWVADAADLHPLVVTVMGGDILTKEQSTSTAIGRKLTRQVLRNADAITAESQFLANQVARIATGLAAKTHRLDWGIAPEIFRPTDRNLARKHFGLREDGTYILSPRGIQPIYNIHVLVDSLSLVLRTFPHTQLLLTECGIDHAYRTSLLRKIHLLHLDHNVVWLGKIPHESMPLLYCAADITVSIASSDGLPRSLIEGMACGSTVLLSNLDRYGELVTHGENVWLVNVHAPAVAEAMLTLLKDPQLRRQLGDRARARVCQQFDYTRDAKQLEQLYFQLKATPPRPPRPFRSVLTMLMILCYQLTNPRALRRLLGKFTFRKRGFREHAAAHAAL